MSSYQYKDFSNGQQIRLVKIKFDEAKPHALNLSLFHTDLDTSPEFDALSILYMGSTRV